MADSKRRPYVAKFRGADGDLYSLLIRIPTDWNSTSHQDATVAQQAASDERWRRFVEELFDTTELDFSWRLSLNTGSIDRMLMLLGPKSAVSEFERMRRLAADLSSTSDQQQPFVFSRDEHDSSTEAIPSLRLFIDHEPFNVKGLPVVCGFQMHPSLSRLFSSTLSSNDRICWQINVCRSRIDREDLRQTRRHALRLRSSSSMPPDCLKHQEEICQKFESHGFLVDEYLSSDSAETLNRLRAVLERQFADSLGRLGFSEIPIAEDRAGDLDDILTMGLHSTRLIGSDALTRASGAISDRELKSLLLWQPAVSRPTKNMRIFISYRREDSHYVAGRIFDRLRHEFGESRVFIDVENIPLGVDFPSVLRREITTSDVLLVVVGQRWLSNAQGLRRLEEPDDFVRFEVETALRQSGTRVAVLLVDGMEMPGQSDLPAGLQELPFRNSLKVRPDPDFHRDMDSLIKNLKDTSSRQSRYGK